MSTDIGRLELYRIQIYPPMDRVPLVSFRSLEYQ